MKKIAAFAAAVAAVLVTVLAAPACSDAHANPAFEVLPYVPETASIIDASGIYTNGRKLLRFDLNDITTGENDTGYNFVAGDRIFDVACNFTTAETTGTTKTIDIGLLSSESGGDADGLIDGMVTSAAGVVQGTLPVTTGTNTKFCAASPTYGVLLSDHQAGTDVDQDEGICIRKSYVVASAVSLTYTWGSAPTEIKGKCYVDFWRKP